MIRRLTIVFVIVALVFGVGSLTFGIAVLFNVSIYGLSDVKSGLALVGAGVASWLLGVSMSKHRA